MVDHRIGNKHAQKADSEKLISSIVINCTKDFKAYVMNAKDPEDKIASIGRNLFLEWASKQYEIKAKYKKHLDEK